MPPTSPRDLIRAALLRGAPKSTPMTIQTDGGPLDLLICEPTFKERNEIITAAAKPGSRAGEVDPGRLQLHALIRLVRDAEGRPVFDLADADLIQSLPASSEIVSRVIPAAIEALKPAEAPAGNAPTPPASSAP